MASDYPSTSVPFENYALPALHDPIVQGPGFAGLEGAAAVYTKLAETLDKAAGDLRAVMTASLGVHEGEAADAARQHINKVATTGDAGAAQARLATLALQEQASYYFRAKLDMKAAAEAAAGPDDEKARVQAIDAARLYQNNSNHNLSNVFQVFDPPKTPAPDISVAGAPHSPGWAQPTGGAAAIPVPTAGAPTATAAPPVGLTPAPIPSTVGGPSAVPPAGLGIAPGPSIAGGSPSVTSSGSASAPRPGPGQMPNSPLAPAVAVPPRAGTSVPSGPDGSAPGPGAPPRTGVTTTPPSTSSPVPDARGRLPGDPGYVPRVPSDPGVGGGRPSPSVGSKPGGGPGWVPGQPWSTSTPNRASDQPGTTGPGAVPPQRPVGGGTVGTEPRPLPGRAPSGAVVEPAPTSSAGAPRGAATNQHGMPFMPMTGAGAGRQDGTHPRPPWLLDADPEQTWMSNLPEHTAGVIEPLED